MLGIYDTAVNEAMGLNIEEFSKENEVVEVRLSPFINSEIN